MLFIFAPITYAQNAGDIACSCVRTARYYGLTIPLMDAADLALLVKNKDPQVPTIGGGILLYYPKTETYHVALIRKFLATGFLVIEGNFKKCVIAPRVVDYNDKYIIAFIRYDTPH